MRRLFLAALLVFLAVIDWFVIEYYKPVKRYQMRVCFDAGRNG